MSNDPALLRDGPQLGPRSRKARVLLAHGAGAGMRSDFMQQLAEALAARKLSVVRFEFPYMQKRATGQRRPPDPQVLLLTTFREQVQALGGGKRVILAGKSMGGRMATMIADEVGARAVLCFGYPFHPPAQPHKLRTAHLRALRTPTLIIQGTRDEFGTREEVASYELSAKIELAWIEDGDHSLEPRKRAGHDPKAAFASVIERAAKFLKQHGG